jgi:L-arabinose isomerase
MEQGTTPTTIKVEADDRVDFRLDNYRERVVVMDSDFNLVAIINGFSIIGWGIDALTGSLKRVNTEYVKVDLEQSDSGNAFVRDAINNGIISEVRINTDDKIIETKIILK